MVINIILYYIKCKNKTQNSTIWNLKVIILIYQNAPDSAFYQEFYKRRVVL